MHVMYICMCVCAIATGNGACSHCAQYMQHHIYIYVCRYVYVQQQHGMGMTEVRQPLPSPNQRLISQSINLNQNLCTEFHELLISNSQLTARIQPIPMCPHTTECDCPTHNRTQVKMDAQQPDQSHCTCWLHFVVHMSLHSRCAVASTSHGANQKQPTIMPTLLQAHNQVRDGLQ
jgi:hypothetical protein